MIILGALVGLVLGAVIVEAMDHRDYRAWKRAMNDVRVPLANLSPPAVVELRAEEAR